VPVEEDELDDSEPLDRRWVCWSCWGERERFAGPFDALRKMLSEREDKDGDVGSCSEVYPLVVFQLSLTCVGVALPVDVELRRRSRVVASQLEDLLSGLDGRSQP
jgi:hypothetical protein